MTDCALKLEKALSYLGERVPEAPKAAVVLGSGLSSVVERLDQRGIIKYAEIPGFPSLMVQGHRGELLYGYMGGRSVLIFNGRFHYYQGYSLAEVTLPVRVAKRLGARSLLLTNASGGIGRGLKPGDIMLIADHINYMGANPLLGINPEEFGQVFVDMTEPYSRLLIDRAKEVARRRPGIGKLKEGVYLAAMGPSYETRSEIAFFRKIGADAVGMSTVPETIVAAHEEMEVLGISVISNMACGMAKGKLSHTDVLRAMKDASERVASLIQGVVGTL